VRLKKGAAKDSPSLPRGGGTGSGDWNTCILASSLVLSGVSKMHPGQVPSSAAQVRSTRLAIGEKRAGWRLPPGEKGLYSCWSGSNRFKIY
jgi:hypothetical protein